MNHSNSTACPLCRSTAAFSTLDTRRKHIACQSCGEFVLWRAAEAQLSRCAEQTLEKFSEEVKRTTNEEYIYVIRGRNEDTLPHVDLHGECMPKSTALS